MAGTRRDPIRVAIVDDHPVFRLGLKRALERESDLEVSWELGSAATLESTMTKSPVDVLLIDVYLGSAKDGISATREVVERWPDVKVAAMSASLDARVSAASTRAGARVFLPKSMPVADVVGSIRRLVAQGGEQHSRSSSHRAKRGPRGRVNGLSPRQRQVLDFIRLGRTNREIATRLGVSVATVNKHVHEILSVLKVRNRTEAAALMTAAQDVGR